MHNLELDVKPLLPLVKYGRVKRAFAKELSVQIPWTQLYTQPIAVRPTVALLYKVPCNIRGHGYVD